MSCLNQSLISFADVAELKRIIPRLVPSFGIVEFRSCLFSGGHRLSLNRSRTPKTTLMEWITRLRWLVRAPWKFKDCNLLRNRPTFTSDITLPKIPAIRQVTNAVLLDIPLFMSHHREAMIEAVCLQANRAYRLWCARNPGFDGKGRVHVIGKPLANQTGLGAVKLTLYDYVL
jgi:hypothetical protein